MPHIGERIKQARTMAALSMRSLASKAGISPAAISKYETGKNVPTSRVLLDLAKALDVKTEFFLRPSRLSLTSPSFRKKSRLPQKAENTIRARVQEWLERYVDAESLLPDPMPPFSLPPDGERQVNSLEEVEDVAISLRKHWDLGLDPIDNLTGLLEDKGIKVGLINGHDGFDALTLCANGMPVIVSRTGQPADRLRMNLSHELGHIVAKVGDHVDEEKVAKAFAGAFLAPRPIVLQELGKRRSKIDPYELHMLKHKYGLSMQGWVYRAKAVGVISDDKARSTFIAFSKKGWRQMEPGDPLPEEDSPMRLERIVIRLLNERIISRGRAAELLGKPLASFWQEVAEKHELPIGNDN